MKYGKAMSLDFRLIDYTRIQKVHLLLPFVCMMERYNVLDDVATMEIGARQIGIDDSSKLV